MKKFLILYISVCAAMLIWSLYLNSKCNKLNSKALDLCAEYAYYEGQKDALKGDIRVDTVIKRFTKSPYSSGKLTIYEPSLSMDSNIKIQLK